MFYSKKIILVIPLAFLLFKQKGQAQFKDDFSSNYGFRVGLNLALGTHFQRLGLNLNFYYTYNFIQANSEIRLYRNFKNLGPPKAHNELVLSQGLVFAYGPTTLGFDPFVNSYSNQSGYQNSVAYVYNAYFNKIKTTQQTGTLAFQFKDLYIISENDLLARPILDRFRTGGFLIMYQYQNTYQFALNCSMWTGQMGNRHNYIDSLGNSRCYMDTVGGLYTNYSHGLLSLQFKTYLDYGQSVQLTVGQDAEQVRDFIQNKIIHDQVFLPKNWRSTKNCHMPMLDENGQQVLDNQYQKIKNPSMYLNVFLNPNLFY